MNRAQRRNPARYKKNGSGLFVPGAYAEPDEQVEYTRVVMDKEDYSQLLSDRGQLGVEKILRELEDCLSASIPKPVRERARASNDKLVAVDTANNQIGFLQVVG